MLNRSLDPQSVHGQHYPYGYEGTGRSLSLKLIEEIRQKNTRGGSQLNSYKKFRQLTMSDPIRYSLNDQLQRQLNELLLLNATEPVPLKGDRLPHPSECQLYIVNRDTLFSYKSSSQKFLFNLMSLFISSHYKNSPNDLHFLSDSPSHLIFVLLGPMQKNAYGKVELPDILCAVQLALEGNLSKATVNHNSKRGIKPSGDLLPWNIREQFQNNDFPEFAGGRVVRIATHAKNVKMGYGTRALQQLADFFEGKLVSLDQEAQIVQYNFKGEGARKPLLKKLEEVSPPQLHYLGTSFGFTQTNTDKALHVDKFVSDFKKRLTNLLGFQFKRLNVGLALQILQYPRLEQNGGQDVECQLDRTVLNYFITLADFNRLKSYTRNQVDYHLILDLVPVISRLYFTGLMGKKLNLGYVNQAILVGLGLQMKTFEEFCKELKDLEVKSALPIFQKTMIKFVRLIEKAFSKQALKSLPEQVTTKQTRVLPQQNYEDEEVELNQELLDQEEEVQGHKRKLE